MINYDGAGVCDDGSRYGWVMVVWLGMVHDVGWVGDGYGAELGLSWGLFEINDDSFGTFLGPILDESGHICGTEARLQILHCLFFGILLLSYPPSLGKMDIKPLDHIFVRVDHQDRPERFGGVWTSPSLFGF